MSDKQDNPTTRREFLRSAAVTVAAGAAATAFSSMPTTAEGMRRVKGANDRILVGHIGLGTQGFGAHVKMIKEKESENNTQQIAVCDLYGRRIRESQKELNLTDSQTCTNHHKLLAIKELDAVVVATSDNWHAQITMDALNAGKHVYCEKPMCKTLEETFAVYDTVKKTKKIFQVGSQGCSDAKWHVAQSVVKAGKIGHAFLGQGSYMRNGKVGEWNNYGRFDLDAGPTATGDAHVDWDTFRKGTLPAEWDPDRFFRWRKYWEYGSGLVGDLFPHRLHPLFIALNISTEGTRGFPLRVSSGGGLYVQKIHTPSAFPDKADQDREQAYLDKYHKGSKEWSDREVPDFTSITADFEDCTIMAISSTINDVGWEDMIRGNKASLYFGGNGVKIEPQRIYADDIDAEVVPVTGPGEDIHIHEKNWFDCIRTNGVPNCNIDIAVRVQTMISMAEMAFRQSKTITFDPKARKVTAL